MTYQPPFHLTHTMTKRVAEISELIGAWKAVNQGALVPELRRGNRIKTIQASLAVEQNTLSVEQGFTKGNSWCMWHRRRAKSGLLPIARRSR